MAEAGFFFVEQPDVVQCIFCDKVLDGWQEDDDPWAEHKSHSSICEFAQLGLSEDFLTFSQLFDLIKDSVLRTTKNKLLQDREAIKKQYQEAKKSILQIKKNA